MKMTFNQYIANPMNSAVMTATMRESMRTSYMNKFNAILLREHSRFNYHLYKNPDKNRYYAVFKIPSETIDKFYYDTVIEFSTDNDVEDAGQDLFKYNVRFFSNDPGFVYTYAYSFSKNDLFINEFKSKMSKKALKEAADQKNPYNQVGYVKTIYFAYLYMQLKSLNKLTMFNAAASVGEPKTIIGTIDSADIKIASREEAGEKLANKKRKEKARKESQQNTVPKSASSAKTSNIKKSKVIGAVSNNVKTTRKTKRK